METALKLQIRFPALRTWLIVLVALQMIIMMPQTSDEAEATTWSSPFIVASGSVLTSMSMAVDGDDIYCVYVFDNRGMHSVVMRTYNGSAWSSMRTVSGTSNNANYPAVAASGGIAHIVYVDRQDGDSDILYRSFNGTHFSTIQQVSSIRGGDNDQDPDIATDGGYVHIVWESLTPTDRDIAYRNIQGGRMSSTFTISTDVNNDLQTDPAVDADDGKAHVVWHEVKAGDATIIYRMWDAGTWQAERNLVGWNDRLSQTNPDIAVEGDDAYIVYLHWASPLTHGVNMVSYVGGNWKTPNGVPTPTGDEYNPRVATEAGHVALAYRTSSTYSSTYFQHFDRQSWGDAEVIEAGDDDSIYYPMDIELLKGRVHLMIMDQELTTRIHRYYTGEVDEVEPSAEVGEVSPYWMTMGRISIPYSASDDYGLDSVTVQYRYSEDKQTWDRWTAITTLDELTGTIANGTVSFSAPDGEGFYEFKAYARDIAGRSEPPTMEPEAEAALDQTSPTVSVLINDGDEYTGDSHVQLNMSYSDVMTDANGSSGRGEYTVELSNDDRNWTEVTVHGNKHAWDLAPGDGDRAVFVRVTDAAGLVSVTMTDSIFVDMTDPNMTLSINEDAEWTTSRDVTLTVTFQEEGSGVAGVRIIDEAVGGDEPWDNPLDTLPWILPEGEGLHTIAYQVIDAAGRTSEVHTATIGLDTEAPTGSILVEGSDTITGEPTVTLVLGADDLTSGVAGIRLLDEAVGGDEPWDNPVETIVWNLGTESGLVTVYYQVQDVAGLESEVYTVSITLDLDSPTGSVALASGATVVNTATVDLALTFEDLTSSVVGIRVSEEAVGGDEPWDNPVETLRWDLSEGDGEKTIYFQVIDEVGHESSVFSFSFLLDTTNPFVDNTDPLSLAEKVPLDKVISVRFSEAMDTDAVESAFTLSYQDGGAPVDVAGTYEWSQDEKTLTFTPDEDLDKNTLYSITITDSALDAAGNTLFPSLEATFTTVKDGGGNGDGDGDDGGLSSGTVLIAVVVVIVVIAAVVGLMYSSKSGKGGQ